MAVTKVQRDCHICGKALVPSDAVRDHDHFTGQFGGLAHNKCNLMYKPRLNTFTQRYFIPIMLHNLRGCDAHFLIQQISPADTTHVIANSMEKYISFSVNNCRFIDSLQFLPASLEKLVNICKSFRE